MAAEPVEPSEASAGGVEVPTDWVVVGRIGGAYGVQGWVRVTSFTEPAGNLLDYRPWRAQQRDRWSDVEVLDVRTHGSGLVARLGGVTDRDAAQRLAGCLIAVPRAALPATEADEYYWRDLIGLEVRDRDGALLGYVDHLLETGAHDVLVVQNRAESDTRPPSSPRLIPFVAQFVVRVDLAAGELIVDWQDPL
ncbi:MAG: ribosome maturation factor RimM [Pseudomonadales bacterium]